MTRTEHALAYSKCSFTELRDFIRERGIDGLYLKDRKDIIRFLRQADREATFPFFDLLPELRNVIYEEVLAIKEVRGAEELEGGEDDSDTEVEENAIIPYICTDPAIHGTCKQVYEEAAGLLYGDHSFNLEFYLWSPIHVDPYSFMILFNDLPVLTELDNEDPIDVAAANVAKTVVVYSPVLQRIQYLQISLRLCAYGGHLPKVERKGALIVKTALEQLYEFLQARKHTISLRKLEIPVESHLQVSEKRLQAALTPLAAISRMVKTYFYLKNVPDQVQGQLRQS